MGLFFPILVLVAFYSALAQPPPSPFPAGQIIPRVVCAADPSQSYALYLPSTFSNGRKWPIVYVFDPAARGPLAAEVVRAAAEKYGYIVAASNNSRNGLKEGPGPAATAMWRDAHERFPLDERRQYTAGMSGGARAATAIALKCDGCMAGVIANAAAFPTYGSLPAHLKFAYFGAVGNADPNYREFVELRRGLEDIGAAYRIRVFSGPHGWAPEEVWMEALDWMDVRAMKDDVMPRDQARIQSALNHTLARARSFEAENDALSALREYHSAVGDFSGLADIGGVKEKAATLEHGQAVKSAEKREKSDVEQQIRVEAGPLAQIERIASGDMDAAGMQQLRATFANLRNEAAKPDPTGLVVRRALGGLLLDVYETGASSLEQKDYRAAQMYFDLAATGARDPSWAHYQLARVFAATARRKEMLSELRLALTGGFHDPAALEAAEFQPYRDVPEFKALAANWDAAARK